MKNKNLYILIIISLFIPCFLFILLNKVFSSKKTNTLPSITIINPIRGKYLGHEKDNLLESLKAQWEITKDIGVNATWLWQYSALEDNSMISYAKTQMKNQEFGLLLEIDRNYATKSGVSYKGQGPSYFSDGLFLVSYDADERHKLIDSAFEKFKKIFGYYPKTVGAWWIGADSIVYMQQKYKIVASFKASEQYDLDVYSIWGTPWSIPYISSKENEGIPANSLKESSKVVMLQWAARDPTRGYKDPLYSLQDFEAKKYNISYFDYLTSLFLKGSLDNVVIGLENGGSLNVFKGHYANVVKEAKKLESEKKITIILAKDYAEKFLSNGKVFSATHYFLSKDYKTSDQSFWYNSSNYRAGIIKKDGNIYLVDLRNYSDKIKEDFFLLPNSQGYLRVDEPAIVDSLRNPSQKVLIATSDSTMTITNNYGIVRLNVNDKTVASFTKDTLKYGQKTFVFRKKQTNTDVFLILLFLLFIYSSVILIYTKNLKISVFQFIPLLLLLFLSFPFLSRGLTSDLTFFMDKKELIFLNFLSFFHFTKVFQIFIILQLVPFLILIFLNFMYVVRNTKHKIIYYAGFITITVLFAHFPYFPLNKSTYIYVLVYSCLLFLALAFTIFLVLKKNTSKRPVTYFVVSILSIAFVFSAVMVLSRTELVVTPFESAALQVVDNLHKNVIYVTETDYSVNPIYRAVKPLLYQNYKYGGILTGTNWQAVTRPQDHILKLSNYKNKLIFVPRYLGADLSNYEMKILKLKKIFDNAQIAIFESEK